MKKFITSLLTILVVAITTDIVAQNTWTGNSGANWNNTGNWSTGSVPDGVTQSLENIIFNSNSQLATTNDLPTTNRWRITFQAGAGVRTITGTTPNTFSSFNGDRAEINNTSGSNQTIDFPIELSSDLYITTSGIVGVTTTFNNTITSAGGNHTIYVDGTGSVNFVGDIADGAGTINVVMQGGGNLTFTGAKTFTGSVVTSGGRTFFNGNMAANLLNITNSSNANFTKPLITTTPQDIIDSRLRVNRLLLSSGGNCTFSNSCSVAIIDSLSIGSGRTFTGTFNLTTTANGFFYEPNAVLAYTGPSAMSITTREWMPGNVDINQLSRPSKVYVTAGVVTILGTGQNRYCPGDLTISEGAVFNIASNNLDIGGVLGGLGFIRGFRTADMTFNGTNESVLRMEQPTVGVPATQFYNTLRFVIIRDNAKIEFANPLVISSGTAPGGVNKGEFQLIGAGSEINVGDGNLIFRSDANGTARFTSISSAVPNPVVGNIVVERFVPEAFTNLGSGRAWRFFSNPVKSSTRQLGKNIAGENWPLGRVTNKDASNVATPAQIPNNGTVVTGRQMNNPEARTYGFDTWNALGRISNSSIRQFQLDPNGGNFSGVTQPVVTSLADNPLSATLDDADQGYMIYIRGDRTVTEPGFGPTKMFFKGENRTATGSGVTFGTPGKAAAKDFVFGNPFACDFDMQAFLGINTERIVNNYYWFWDPNVGDFGSWNLISQQGENLWLTNTNQSVPFGYSIHSGQAVIIISKDTLGGAPSTLTYDENMKADQIGSYGILPFEEVDEMQRKLPARFTANYYKVREDNNKVMIGGAIVVMGDHLKNELGDNLDVDQMVPFGSNRNISIRSFGKSLAMEGRNSIVAGDKIFYRVGGLDVGTHMLKFLPAKLEGLGLEAYLLDNFLNTEKRISLSDSTEVSFEVTSEVGSSASNRFEVEFRTSSTLPVNFVGINAAELLGDVNVKWNIAAEKGVKHYEVLHSSNGSDFAKEGTVVARNADGAADYSFTHVQPGAGNHFYRVRSLDFDGKALLSQVVKVNIGANGEGVNVFPTVINKGNVTIQFTNITKGRYTLQLSDASGRVMMTQNIDHNGGSASQTINVPANMSKGNYNLRVSGEGVNYMQRLIKQ